MCVGHRGILYRSMASPDSTQTFRYAFLFSVSSSALWQRREKYPRTELLEKNISNFCFGPSNTKKIEIENWVADDVCARGISRFRTYVSRIDEIPGELHEFLARTCYSVNIRVPSHMNERQEDATGSLKIYNHRDKKGCLLVQYESNQKSRVWSALNHRHWLIPDYFMYDWLHERCCEYFSISSEHRDRVVVDGRWCDRVWKKIRTTRACACMETFALSTAHHCRRRRSQQRRKVFFPFPKKTHILYECFLE